MSQRIVREKDDEILRKKSKDVTELTEKYKELISDMKETMTTLGGCGLAAVQVGILKKIIICQPDENGDILTLINPEIKEESCEVEEGSEGCLSVDGYKGVVVRPKRIVVRAKDENMKDIEFDADGFLARIICHEVDHLNGILYTDKVVPGTLTNGQDGKEDD